MFPELNHLGIIASKLWAVHRPELILIVTLLAVSPKEVNRKRLLVVYQDGGRLLGYNGSPIDVKAIELVFVNLFDLFYRPDNERRVSPSRRFVLIK